LWKENAVANVSVGGPTSSDVLVGLGACIPRRTREGSLSSGSRKRQSRILRPMKLEVA
jgi:hypothetical protein